MHAVREGRAHESDRLYRAVGHRPIGPSTLAEQLASIPDGKKVLRVFDYADAQVPMLARMYEKRIKGYRAIGYEIESIAENERTDQATFDPSEMLILLKAQCLASVLV
jgi:hypothetical protein